MFCGIFLCVIIFETILVASSESNYDNGLLYTVTLENNNTPRKHQTNANVIRKWLERKNLVEDPSPPTNFNSESQSDEEDDRTTNFSFQKVGNNQQTTDVYNKIMGRWVSLMKNKLKNQIPVLKAHEQYIQPVNVLPRLAAPQILREGGVIGKTSSARQDQLPNIEENYILTPGNFVPRPWWMQSQLEYLSTEIENVQLTTEPQESILLKKENQKQNIALKKIALNVENKTEKNKTGSEERKQPIPKKSSTQRIHALKVEKTNTATTTATPETDFQNWGLIIFDSKTNKLFEDEHDELENELQKNKKQPEATPQSLLESVEVDDDRNKALRQKVESWYGNLQYRRKLATLGVSPEMENIVRFRRNLQSALAAFSQKRLLSEWQRSDAADYRRLSRWRRQLLSQYSMPQAVDYRRLLSLWQKELRRQLQIKWNRRPLVEISPGAFKSDIYVNPPDDLAKHMQKLLALKKRQEERNRDLNAGTENPE